MAVALVLIKYIINTWSERSAGVLNWPQPLADFGADTGPDIWKVIRMLRRREEYVIHEFIGG